MLVLNDRPKRKCQRMLINWTPLLLKIYIMYRIITPMPPAVQRPPYPHGMGMSWRARIYTRPCKIDRFCHQWQNINSFVNTHYQNDAFTRPLEGVIFLEKVKNVRNVDGPGRSEQLIMWDENRLMKFVCEAWRWWDETEEEETCGQTQLWAMNLRHLIFQLHWKNSLQQFSVLSCEGCCADIHICI